MLVVLGRSLETLLNSKETSGEIKMSNHHLQCANALTFARNLFAAALVLGCALSATDRASAQTVTPPPTPTQITPEAGNSAFLVGHAFGTQGYTCVPTPTGGTSWSVNPARPEATLFSNVFGQLVQIITHFTSINENPKDGKPPSLSGNVTWQGFDTSRVWAKATGILPRGHRSRELPEHWRDSLPAAGVNRQSKGTHRRSASGRHYVYPTAEHQGRGCAYHRLHCRSDPTRSLHRRLLLLPED